MPGLPVVFHPDAVDEAHAARMWYAERSQSAADSFLAELDLGIEFIADAPERWPLFVNGTRRYLFHRFPFQIVYRVMNDRVEVVAVAHGRRRPGYWKKR
ncbi:MAG TPA: type II toxin-antitoxin system RelE/ParE family toxin [Nitrospira sp.]